jgi:hypothetical protein
LGRKKTEKEVKERSKVELTEKARGMNQEIRRRRKEVKGRKVKVGR